jgi:hypothetical protein
MECRALGLALLLERDHPQMTQMYADNTSVLKELAHVQTNRNRIGFRQTIGVSESRVFRWASRRARTSTGVPEGEELAGPSELVMTGGRILGEPQRLGYQVA